MSTRKAADVSVGDTLPERKFQLARANLVRYAGASGDFNVIHWNERTAKAVGLPDVISHGMLTMATVGRVVTDWTGDPTALREYGVRFSKPVVVPDDDTGATVTVSGVVEEKSDDGTVRIGLTATSALGDVLTGAFAVVRLPA